MRFDIIAFAVVMALIPVAAFVPIQRSAPELRKLAFSFDDDAEDRLDQMVDKWTELKEKEKEIEKEPDDVRCLCLSLQAGGGLDIICSVLNVNDQA